MDDEEADAKIKAEYSAFANPVVYPQVEIKKGAGKVDDKTSADDGDDREELYRGHGYLLFRYTTDTLLEDKDAKIICNTREEDPEDGIVVYSVPNLEKLDQLKKRIQKDPVGNDKTESKGRSRV